MGTRGVCGFRINGEDLLNYQQFDSYPTGVGAKIMENIREFSNEQLAAAAIRIQVIDDKIPPTDEQIEECKSWADTSVSSGTLKDWYCLLRKCQGTLQPFVEGMKYLANSKDFLYDSVFCEWGYIVNLDTGNLEIYRGFNKKKRNDAGRYADKTMDENEQYWGCTLFKEIALDKIRKLKDVGAFCKKLEKEAYSDED